MKKCAILAAVLSVPLGCTVGPDYHSPKITVLDKFGATQGSTTQPTTETVVDLRRWWESFNDERLNHLIDTALTSNLDVRLAEARVREARAQLEFTRAGLFPTADGSASYSRSRASRNALGVGSVGAGSAVSTGGTGGTGTGGTSGGTTGTGGSTAVSSSFSFGDSNFYQAGFDAGWEIDVFGGTRRAIEAATYALESQQQARRNAMVTLLSEIARNYILLRGYQHQLAIARSNILSQRDSLELQRQKLQAGIATDLTVAQAEALLASTESEIPTLETQVQQSIHRLGVLLDKDPTALEADLIIEAPLPIGPPAIPPGLPSELLRRRPDVRQAERQLATATADIGVATADLFPKFSLTGSLGLESLQLKTFTNSPSTFWSIGPTVSWRIFDAGQIHANVRVRNARRDEALIQYRQTVLTSIEDVENALVAYDREQVRRQSLRRAVESNRRSVDLATQLNAAGVVDFLNVLTAQQSLFQSEDQLAQSDRTVSTNLVALYKALGGGWETTEPQEDAGSQTQMVSGQPK